MSIGLLYLLISFALGLISYKIGIPILRSWSFGQQVRDDGPEAHKKKSGTPTMGGIFFVVVSLICSIPLMVREVRLIPLFIVTLLYAFVGFLDDYKKIKKKNTVGLHAWQKLLLQLVLAILFAVFVYQYGGKGGEILIPFSGHTVKLSLPVYAIFTILVFLGTDNGVNFTDGLDGLCAAVTVPVLFFFTYLALQMKSAYALAATPLTGALLAFLIYNSYPAKVFMGDTGSLGVGGFLAAFACLTGSPLFIPIVGLIYVIEVLSVILQVGYFKLTKGKRIFRMAPFHHHLELGGWSETRIVMCFAVITLLLALIAGV